jgi:hypothetical protein
MGGQDGFSRDLLKYGETSTSVLGGLRFYLSKKAELGLNLAYTGSEAGLDPFDLPADDYVAITPPMTYDFSRSHTYSKLDVTRVDGDIDFKYEFDVGFWLRANYKYIDYKDDSPYMYDTTGAVSWATLAVGWYF